jgi:hypothetical protein
MRWAEHATGIEHAEALLDMATAWAEAAAQLDHQHNLVERFNEATVIAGSRLQAAKGTTKGANRPAAEVQAEPTDGRGEPNEGLSARGDAT